MTNPGHKAIMLGSGDEKGLGPYLLYQTNYDLAGLRGGVFSRDKAVGSPLEERGLGGPLVKRTSTTISQI